MGTQPLAHCAMPASRCKKMIRNDKKIKWTNNSWWSRKLVFSNTGKILTAAPWHEAWCQWGEREQKIKSDGAPKTYSAYKWETGKQFPRKTGTVGFIAEKNCYGVRILSGEWSGKRIKLELGTVWRKFTKNSSCLNFLGLLNTWHF